MTGKDPIENYGPEESFALSYFPTGALDLRAFRDDRHSYRNICIINKLKFLGVGLGETLFSKSDLSSQ